MGLTEWEWRVSDSCFATPPLHPLPWAWKPSQLSRAAPGGHSLAGGGVLVRELKMPVVPWSEGLNPGLTAWRSRGCERSAQSLGQSTRGPACTGPSPICVSLTV